MRKSICDYGPSCWKSKSENHGKPDFEITITDDDIRVKVSGYYRLIDTIGYSQLGPIGESRYVAEIPGLALGYGVTPEDARRNLEIGARKILIKMLRDPLAWLGFVPR